MSTQVFVLELPIKDSDDVVRFLNRKFDFALSLYNATLHTALGRLERMRNSREWREAILLPKGKERSRKLAEIRFSFGLTEFSLGKIATATEWSQAVCPKNRSRRKKSEKRMHSRRRSC